MKLAFFGAMNEVGGSSVLLKVEERKFLFDCGCYVREKPLRGPLEIPKVNLCFLTHCHLDHSGFIPLVSAPIISTNVTKPLLELLLLDTLKIARAEDYKPPFNEQEIKACLNRMSSLAYGEGILVDGISFKLINANHIPGAFQILVKNKEKTLLYTSDFNTIQTKLLKKSEFPFEKIDYLIIEGTYFDREHPERASEELKLKKEVKKILNEDGIALIAGFAIARLQEILLVLWESIDFPIYIDGLAIRVCTIINKFKEYLKEANELALALSKAEYVKNGKMRKKIIKEPCVILSTSGFLDGGPISFYLEKLWMREECGLILTSYQIENTPGRILLEKGLLKVGGKFLKPKLSYKQLDFSSHCGRKELFDFISKIEPEKIFCVHCENAVKFAEELKAKGFDAIAPLPKNNVFKI